MLRLAANLSTLFTDRPLRERFEAAARAGFRAVEIQFPYELEPAEVARLLAAHALELVLFNAPPGDAARGDRGLAGVPGREREFRESVARALEYAEAAHCPRVHVMAGMGQGPEARAAQLDLFTANLAEAADRAAPLGVSLLVEPINPRDVPGYLMNDTGAALAVLDAAGRANTGLQFDFYHQQILHGDLARRFDELLPRIRHVQLADNPGRHEPGTGEIAWDFLLAHVEASPYEGWVGCEYNPLAKGEESLRWARRWLGGEARGRRAG